MTLVERIGSRRVYLDANVFIYVVEGIEAHAPALRPLLPAVASGRVSAVTSALTLAEVLVHPFRTGNVRREQAFARTVRSGGGLTVEPVTEAVLIGAARVRADRPSFKLPDAIHVATAQLAGCAVLVTNDAGIAAAPGVEVVRLSDAAHG